MTTAPTPLRIGSLFSGYGGLDLAAEHHLEAETIWHVDNDPAAAAVLATHWPHVPNLGDVTTVDWNHVEPPDVLTGGFPCQDVSVAGHRAGMTPTSRSGLWEHMAQAVHMLHPRLVVIENVKGLLSADAHCDVEPCPWCMGNTQHRPLRALGAVLGDLAQLGYDTRWCGLRAADIGAAHARYRVFLTAWPTTNPRRQRRKPRRRTRQPTRTPAVGNGAPTATDTNRLGPVRDRTTRRRGHRPTHHSRAAGHDTTPQWGHYTQAIRRWEHVLGRDAPDPTQTGRRGGPVLAPAFVEWLMGLHPGHVTNVDGLTRNDQLRLLGNGVIPQQATAALALLGHDNRQVQA